MSADPLSTERGYEDSLSGGSPTGAPGKGRSADRGSADMSGFLESARIFESMVEPGLGKVSGSAGPLACYSQEPT